MELAIETNRAIRTLYLISKLFSGRDPDMAKFTQYMARYAMFFGDKLNNAALIQYMVNKLKPNEMSELYNALFDKKISKTGKNPKIMEIVGSLTEMQLDMGPDKVVEEAAKKLLSRYKKLEDNLSYWVSKIFGFSLPKQLHVILHVGPFFGNGDYIYSNPPTIALAFDFYKDDVLGILVHEMLHYLIDKNGMKARLANIDANFEEALLDYFSPDGILDEKLGLIGKFDLDFHQRMQVSLRHASYQISERLLPIIKEYYKQCENVTIWNFLKSNHML